MPYRSAGTSCLRHPLTAATAACEICGREVCDDCGSWLALRFRCLDCAARYRRWERFRGRFGRWVLLLPLCAAFSTVGVLIVVRPTPQYLPFVEPDVQPETGYVRLASPERCHHSWRREGKDVIREIIDCW
jgi:hypothetical protein